jgi:hypothetical protein
MYRWIWRRLPFGAPGKVASMALLLAAVVALLWFIAFPVVDRLLPTNDGRVTAPVGTTQPR